MKWIDTTVGEYCPFIYGKGLPKDKRKIGEFPVYGSNGIVGYHNTPYAANWGVIIGRKGSVGSIHLSKNEFWPIDTTFYMVKESIEELYFAYFLLKSLHLEQMNSDSAVPGLNRDNAHALPIRIPENEDDRKSLGDWIIKFEEKIELNTQINQTLEQIAQALFKSWFVDFDPVKAKIDVLEAGGTAEAAELAAMSTIAAKSPEQLADMQQTQPEAYQQLAQTAALFPAAMQDSELGKIPEGWSINSLSELITLTGGGTPKRSESSYWGGNIPWLSVRDLPLDGGIFVTDTEEKITELGLKNSATKLLPAGTAIITARGTVGKLALLAGDMCMNQSCYAVTGRNYGPCFNYFYLAQAVSTLKQNTHGAVFDTITTSTFETYKASYCQEKLSNHFEEIVTPLMEAIKSNLLENTNLATTRDTLLPKLLSGAIDLAHVNTASPSI